ncbi:MAG: L-threonylcarbamoyladenylate synthase [bacterium]
MKVLQATIDNINVAANVIKNGGIVVFPTDTVYGIGCDLHNADAVDRIYNLKGRPSSMPLIAMFSSIEDYHSLTDQSYPNAEKYMYKWWPGALTIILPSKKELPQRVIAGGNTIGMRIPAHNITIALLAEVGLPMATTSANLSGLSSTCNVGEVIQSLGMNTNVDIILDGGNTPGGIPSTLLDCTKNPPAILRSGDITAEMLGL